MQELLEMLGPELTPLIQNLLLTLVGVLFTYLGIQARKLMARAERSREIQEIRDKLKANEELVNLTVKYVEKIGEHLSSNEKFNLAMEKAIEIANQRGLDITRTEIEVLIEGLLLKFEEGYKSDIHVEQNLIRDLKDGDINLDENNTIVFPDDKKEENK